MRLKEDRQYKEDKRGNEIEGEQTFQNLLFTITLMTQE
jgi:hypothetical protein